VSINVEDSWRQPLSTRIRQPLALPMHLCHSFEPIAKDVVMNHHLASISHRQITGRWMDRAFVVLILAFAVIGANSVAMGVHAANAPTVVTR
jgi:hypothetical protein